MHAARNSSSARTPNLLRSLGACVWITLGLACTNTPDSPDSETAAGTESQGSTETETETEGTNAACDVIDVPVDDVSCGTYEDSDEGCGGEAGTGGDGTGGGGTGGGGTGGGETGGGSESGGVCEADEAANDAVVACVAQAVSDGVAFSFGYHYYRNGGQYNTRDSYHVGADGSFWSSSSGDSDLCTFSRSAVYPPLDLSTCGSYGCIRSAANGPALAVCMDEENCDGI